MSVTRVTGSQWLVDYSVTTIKIGDNQVTPEKLDEELNYRVNALDVNDLVQINSDGSIVARGGIYFKDITGTIDILKIDPITRLVTTSDDLIVGGNLTVLGEMTYLTSATLNVADQNITLNKGGTLVTQTGSGLTIEATNGDNGSLIYDASTSSKWKLGIVGTEDTVVTENYVQSLTNKTITDPSNTIDSRVVTYNALTSGLPAVNVQQALDAIDNNLDSEIARALNVEALISANLSAEVARATNAERILQENITTEATTRLIEDTVLHGLITDETLRATNAETLLQTNLDIETLRATNAETLLQSNIDAEVLRATTAEANLSTDILNETLRATNAETLLQSNIDVEKFRIDGILLGANANLDSFAEIVALINSVDTVNDTAFASYVLENNLRVSAVENSVTAETLRATNAETLLQSNIDAETIRAVTAEELLQTNLAFEVLRATTAEAELRAETNVETLRAMSAETVLRSQLLNETLRATTAENLIQANLSAEVARATTAESLLQTSIDGLALSASTTLDAEVIRATTAESLLRTDLNTEILRAVTKENIIQTNLTNEIIRAVGTETVIQNELAIEKARIDSILIGAGADLNSFTEIVNFINTLNIADGTALTNYVVSNDIRVNALEMGLTNHLNSTIAHKSTSITHDPIGTTLVSTNVSAVIGELSNKLDAVKAVPDVIGHNLETIGTDGVTYFWKPDLGGGVVQGKYVEPYYYDVVRARYLSHATDIITFYTSGANKNAMYMNNIPIVSNVRPFNVLDELCVIGYEYYESKGLNTNTSIATLRDMRNGNVVNLLNIGIVGNNVTESIVMNTNLLLTVGTRLASYINNMNTTDLTIKLHVKRVYNP